MNPHLKNWSRVQKMGKARGGGVTIITDLVRGSGLSAVSRRRLSPGGLDNGVERRGTAARGGEV